MADETKVEAPAIAEAAAEAPAMVAEVEVDLRSGVVRPKRFIIALDCGPVSNPDGLRNQIEGGILQGMSRSLSDAREPPSGMPGQGLVRASRDLRQRRRSHRASTT